MLIEMTHQTRVKGLIVEPGDTIETTAKEAQFLVRMGWARRLTPSPERELAVASSGETRRAK